MTQYGQIMLFSTHLSKKKTCDFGRKLSRMVSVVVFHPLSFNFIPIYVRASTRVYQCVAEARCKHLYEIFKIFIIWKMHQLRSSRQK